MFKKFIQILEHEFLAFWVLIYLLEHHSPDEDLAARVSFSFTGRDTRADTPDPSVQVRLSCFTFSNCCSSVSLMVRAVVCPSVVLYGLL